MKTYEEIAESASLDSDTSARYINYMRARWADSEEEKCQVGYALEWAHRFKDGREFAASDFVGQRLLLKTDAMYNA